MIYFRPTRIESYDIEQVGSDIVVSITRGGKTYTQTVPLPPVAGNLYFCDGQFMYLSADDITEDCDYVVTIRNENG